MPALVCRTCRRPFEGRPNRRYCSKRCQRYREEKRRAWSRLTAGAERLRRLAAAADDPLRRQALEERAAHFLEKRPEEGRPDPAQC